MLRQDDLSPTGLRYLGLLRVRVGRYADATPLLEQAAETPELALSSKFLHALALVRADGLVLASAHYPGQAG